MKIHTRDTNSVFLTGKVSYLQFSHMAYDKSYYTAKLAIERTSGQKDYLPIIIAETLHSLQDIWQVIPTSPLNGDIPHLIDVYIYVNGQFRSVNQHIDNRNLLKLNVFAFEIGIWQKADNIADKNEIYLNGYICKKPLYRKTPKGREITEILIAVNRPHRQSDYLPCICWGKDAKDASHFPVGSQIKIWGRIQSREYLKKFMDRQEVRTAYEVSVSRIEFILDGQIR